MKDLFQSPVDPRDRRQRTGGESSDVAAPSTSPTSRRGFVCQELSGGYGPLTIIRDIDLEVAPGEFVAILGANGAGKSTLLKALMGTIRHTGLIKLDGQAISTLLVRERVRRGLTLVPESRGNLFGGLTVAENLLLASRRHPDPDEGLAQVHDLFGRVTSDRAEAVASSLSGGEQQMVALGMALLARPRLLLLDEPSQGLAPVVLRDIAVSLRALHDTGIAILLAEQDREFAESVAGRQLVLERGRLLHR